jgi:hypothetical protein
LVALFAARPKPAQAQNLEEPRARQGFWLGFGATGVGAQLVEKGKLIGIYPGGAFSFRVGQLLTRRLGVGFSFDYAYIRKNGNVGGLEGLAIEVNANLWRNLSVHSGAGFGVVTLTDQNSEDKTLRGGAGSYYLAGVSYDFFPLRKRLTGGWALTPTINFRAMPDGNIHSYTLFAGLQVIRWSGLSDNMLNLPPEQ